MESISQFEKRKVDHLKISLDPQVQTEGLNRFKNIQLNHCALPEIDFSEISTSVEVFGSPVDSPIFVSSMTAGSEASLEVNLKLATFCERKNILMGVGSQRRQLLSKSGSKSDSLSAKSQFQEWQEIRKNAPGVKLIGNIGIAQLIQSSISDIQNLVESIQAKAIFVHLNPLQECLQYEGTPNFKGGLQAIKNLTQELKVPVIIKEVGCGISQETFLKLNESGVYAVDVAGLGGTHWGRVEGQRHKDIYEVAQTFKDWGLSTVESLIIAKKLNLSYKVWASGGVRNGLDVAKSIVLGAELVGLAKPWLEAVKSDSKDALDQMYEKILSELKITMFCTGSRNMTELSKKEWQWLSF